MTPNNSFLVTIQGAGSLVAPADYCADNARDECKYTAILQSGYLYYGKPRASVTQICHTFPKKVFLSRNSLFVTIRVGK